jgi:rubrerythrin
MMDREKRIEQMAKELKDSLPITDTGCAMIATILVDDFGYQKQSEGHFILFKPRRENRNATYRCSVCGKLCSSYYNDVGWWNFCPNCGAHMKGGAVQ